MINHEVSESLEYINKFIDSNYETYHMDMNEFQPHKGYGDFEQSADIVQGMRNIVHTLSDVFAGASIPEKFASPVEYENRLKSFLEIVKRENSLSKRVMDFYGEKGSSAPDPVRGLYEMSNSTLMAFEYALDMLSGSGNIQAETSLSAIDENLRRLLTRFDQVVQQLQIRRNEKGSPRSTINVNDEYDVQDLLRSLLYLFYDDVREEEYTPSYAGSSKRVDFLLKNEKVVIEVKKTRSNLRDKKLGEELTIDIASYKVHQDCQKLYCFIYDPDKFISNKNGLIADLEKQSTDDFEVVVIITQ